MTYSVVRAFQVIVNTLQLSPEKAGVGGSTPSLATTFQSTYSESHDNQHVGVELSPAETGVHERQASQKGGLPGLLKIQNCDPTGFRLLAP